MGAFYSGTDDNNDKSGIYYSGVIGKLTDVSYEYVMRFNLYEQKKKCTLGEVFDVKAKETTVPAEWLNQVEDSKPKYNLQVINNNRNLPSSLWDQTSNGSRQPFGFNEIDARHVAERNGGKKNSEKKEVEKRREETLSTEWPYVPGPMDLDMPSIAIEDTNGYAEIYGPDAAEAYCLIDDFLPNLEECDEALLDLITQCHGLLSSGGQMKLATEGIR